MEYKFTDLTAIADYFEYLGKSRRVSAGSRAVSKPRRAELLMYEAMAWEFAADILRNSEIDAPGHPVGDGMKRTQEIMERMSSKPGDDQ